MMQSGKLRKNEQNYKKQNKKDISTRGFKVVCIIIGGF